MVGAMVAERWSNHLFDQKNHVQVVRTQVGPSIGQPSRWLKWTMHGAFFTKRPSRKLYLKCSPKKKRNDSCSQTKNTDQLRILKEATKSGSRGRVEEEEGRRGGVEERRSGEAEERRRDAWEGGVEEEEWEDKGGDVRLFFDSLCTHTSSSAVHLTPQRSGPRLHPQFHSVGLCIETLNVFHPLACCFACSSMHLASLGQFASLTSPLSPPTHTSTHLAHPRPSNHHSSCSDFILRKGSL